MYLLSGIFAVKCTSNIITLWKPTYVSVFALGVNNVVFSPHNLAKNLTPSLLKTRKRFETMSAGSTTTDTEGGISPMWESEEVSDVNL